MGKTYPIQYVGHGDFVETSAGEWYMVMLAVRPLDGYTTMGRETFLAKVDWEDGWPVVNPGSGVLTDEVRVWLKEWNPLTDPKSYTNRREAEGLPRNAFPGSSRVYDFKKQTGLGDEFLFLRSCPQGMYRLEPGQGLCLKGQKVTLKEQGSPSYIGIRQQHHRFRIQANGPSSYGDDIPRFLNEMWAGISGQASHWFRAMNTICGWRQTGVALLYICVKRVRIIASPEQIVQDI